MTANDIAFYIALLFLLVFWSVALYIARYDEDLELSYVEFHRDNFRGMCQFVASRFHLLPRKPKKRPAARAKSRTSRAKKSAARAV